MLRRDRVKMSQGVPSEVAVLPQGGSLRYPTFRGHRCWHVPRIELFDPWENEQATFICNRRQQTLYAPDDVPHDAKIRVSVVTATTGLCVATNIEGMSFQGTSELPCLI